MDEIAAEAGTSKSIVYRYFEDKTGLQIAVAELVISDISAALDAAVSAADTPRAGLRAMIGVYLEMVEHSPNVYFFVTRPLGEDASGEVGHFIEAITRLVAAPFARVLSGTSGDGAAPPLTTAQADVVAAWAAGAVGFVRGVGEWWLTGGDGLTRAELADQTTQWLWTGPVAASLPDPDAPRTQPAKRAQPAKREPPTTRKKPAATSGAPRTGAQPAPRSRKDAQPKETT